MVKNPLAKAQDTRNAGSVAGFGRSPGGGSGNHSSILAWKISQPEDPGGVYSPWGRKTSAVTEHINDIRPCASSILRPFPFCLTGM